MAGYVAILPWLLGFVIFSAGPIVASFVLMFMRWEVLTPPTWAGLREFRPADPRSAGAGRPVEHALLHRPGRPAAPGRPRLAPALLLNVGVRGTNVYRLLLYLPSQIPASSPARFCGSSSSARRTAWPMRVLGWFGIPAQQWLYDVNLVKPSLIIMAVWSFGGAMIIFLAGLQGIPEALYEAARIDGAGTWRLFRHITLPLLSPTIFFNLIIGIIGSFQVFTNVLIMTDGGPATRR